MKKLLISFLLVTSTLAYAEEGYSIFVLNAEEAAQLIINLQAGVQAKKLAQMTDSFEIDAEIRNFLDHRKETLKQCEDPAANGNICQTFVSFFEKMISDHVERKLKLEETLKEENNSQAVAEKVEEVKAAIEASSPVQD